MVKILPTMQESQVQSLGQEDPLEKQTVTHSSILAWRTPMDRGAGRVTVHGVAKSRTRLSDQLSLFQKRSGSSHSKAFSQCKPSTRPHVSYGLLHVTKESSGVTSTGRTSELFRVSVKCPPLVKPAHLTPQSNVRSKKPSPRDQGFCEIKVFNFSFKPP